MTHPPHTPEPGGPTTEHLEYVETELMALRRQLRLWVATSNAPVAPWFNGSRVLQKGAIRGIQADLLMAIRQLLDVGMRNENGLCSLDAALRSSGHGDIADDLRASDDAKHLRLVADKTIAHAKPATAKAAGKHPTGLAGGEFQCAMVARVVDAMSKAYLEHLNPSLLSLDPTISYDDPIFQHMPTEGLPVVDFTPGDVFLNDEGVQ